MSFIADLHIHSHYSRATSKNLNLEHLSKWAQLKGLKVIATGDYTHPGWLKELKQKLQPAEEGLYALKKEYAEATQREVPHACESDVRFILSTEISNIYKKGDKVRKVHNVVMSPSLETAEKIHKRLDAIGNVRSDGRPILGLDSRDLLEIVLEEDENACLIPAHIWTPWFSAMGSKSGFDSIQECYGDLSDHIFAVETGLSSDPPMNWRVSSLDKYTLVSNSDAHSPQKLAREANIFKCELSYPGMIQAMKSGDPAQFGGTIEFYPEEGKYHYDGHRKCGIRLSPKETEENGGICPVCGKKVTLGVSYRVEVLADREPGARPEHALPFESHIPLPEIISEVVSKGVNTKTVSRSFESLLSKLGSELDILRAVPVEDIEHTGGGILREAIERVRNGKVNIDAGYDGEFGVVKLFTPKERDQFLSKTFFVEKDIESNQSERQAGRGKKQKKTRKSTKSEDADTESETGVLGQETVNRAVRDSLLPFGLNKEQLEAVETTGENLLIVAGPGTGKTHTLTYRIFYLITECDVPPEHILAVTFTNKAAAEMRTRLNKLVGVDNSKSVTIRTFHALGASILRENADQVGRRHDFSIYNDPDRKILLKSILNTKDVSIIDKYFSEIAKAKNSLQGFDDLEDREEFARIFRQYNNALSLNNAFDYNDLISEPYYLFHHREDILKKYTEKFKWISIDEYQDINYAQYSLIRKLITDDTNVCAIGDPDQAIYGFRGSDYRYFQEFKKDFENTKIVYLNRNYRSSQSILEASDQIISKSANHDIKKRVWSNIIHEGKLDIFRTPSDKAEAETIVHKIEDIVGATSFFSMDSGRVDSANIHDEVSFKDIAVFYRLHAQLPAIEEAFLRSGIPYQSFGTTNFWEIREVKEVLSYLRVITNPHSDIDLYRVLRVPPRGIGDNTIESLFRYRNSNEISLWDAMNNVHLISSLSESQKIPIVLFKKKIISQSEKSGRLSLFENITHILSVFGLKSYYKDDEKRNYYWSEILKYVQDLDVSIEEFLTNLSIQTETDYYDSRVEKVSIMSLHAAKGLEFPIVFIAGCEDGIIPFLGKNSRQIDIEEERRLFYVGMTRAKFKLYLVYALGRYLFGEHRSGVTSRFLADIENELKEYHRAHIHKKKLNAHSENASQLSLF